MAVLQIKSVPTCKLCTAASATLINTLLEQRHNKERDADGNLITYKTVTESLPSYGVEASMASVKRHVAKHLEFVSEKEAELRAEAEKAAAESTLEVFERVLGSDWRERDVSPDEILELHRALYVKELAAKAERGEPLGISHDHALKGVGEVTKRKHNAAQNELLLALAASASGEGMAESSYRTMLEQENPIVVEYEVVEEPVELPPEVDDDVEGGQDGR